MRLFSGLFALLALAAPGAQAERVGSCADIEMALAGAPGGEERERIEDWRRVCALPIDDMTPSRALTLLQGEPLAVEREGDVFTIVAKADAESANLCCTFQTDMAPLADSDLRAVRYRLARLDEAMIFLVPPSDFGRPDPGIVSWRGPKAPTAPQPVEHLSGAIINKEFYSETLGETRRVEIYLPKDYKAARDLHVLILADGLGMAPYLVERLVEADALPPFAMIGLLSGKDGVVEDRADLGVKDLRAADYLPGFDETHDRFRRHQAFVFDELSPALRREYGLPTEAARVAVSGRSNGAAFALFTALDRPDAVGAAVVNSAGWRKTAEAGPEGPRARFFLSAGLYEPSFLRSTRKSADALSKGGYEVMFEEYAAGHAPDQWDVALIEGLTALFAASK